VNASKASGSFFEKKEPKKLLFTLGQCWLDRDSPEESKVFCGAFLQKSDRFISSYS
jgi:hypothetical protein